MTLKVGKFKIEITEPITVNFTVEGCVANFWKVPKLFPNKQKKKKFINKIT